MDHPQLFTRRQTQSIYRTYRKSKEKIINERVKEYLNSVNKTTDEYKKELKSIYQVNNKLKNANDYLEDLFWSLGASVLTF